MHSLLHRALPCLLVIGVVGCLSLLVGLAPSPAAAQTTIHLSLEPRPNLNTLGAQPGAGIPWNCSTWHELYPNYCASHHQDAFYDNGDGVVSPCDYIRLDGICYHITWVGPTYYMTRLYPLPSQPLVAEPITSNSGEDPVCETWHGVYPDYCLEFHVDAWCDNNLNGILDACDQVGLRQPGAPECWMYHIDRVALDIKVVPSPLATPTNPSSWGRLKSLYR